MKIYLIRHGESTSDIKQKYDGDYDDHLTKEGLKEAEIVADKLADKKIQVIFSSAKIRARETAEILKKNFMCTVKIVKGLNEQDIYGAYKQLGKEQPEEEYRKLGELLANRDRKIQGVETYEQFKNRVMKSFLKLTKSSYNSIAVVTHGGPIRCIFRETLNRGKLHKIHNGEIFIIDTQRFVQTQKEISLK